MGMPCNNWPTGQTWHFPAEQDGADRLVLFTIKQLAENFAAKADR
ncbi:hypothetical protein ACFW6E_25600 [Streptomyces olivaceoviridis]